MEKEELKRLIKNIGIGWEDPHFYRALFREWIKEDGNFLGGYDYKSEAVESYYVAISGIQDPVLYRILSRARYISLAILDEKGEIKKERIKNFIKELEKGVSLPYPEGEYETHLMRHMQKVLQLIFEEERFLSLFKRFTLPVCHKRAEEFIRDALMLSLNTRLTNAHLKAAVFSALLAPLRQNVGSCFATAPAILIHDQNPYHLLNDLFDLLMTGKLKRTFGGNEYVTPLCPTWGLGQLSRTISLNDPSLRIWYSPGLIAAFVAISFIDTHLPFLQKVDKLKMLLLPILEEERILKIEKLIHLVLIKHFKINEEELEIYQIEKEGGPFYRQLNPKKEALCEEMLALKAVACNAFKAKADHSLLKAWEFTIASFCDTKVDFSKWNLYASLGLNPQQPGGIGEVIFHHLENRLKEANESTQKWHNEYERAFNETKATESLFRSSETYNDARRIKAEHQARMHHMYSLLDLRNESNQRAFRYSQFYDFLINQYTEYFQEYFQEIYDPSMEDIEGVLFEDSPAGFRLIFKHGRSDPSQWTMIQNGAQYIQALTIFFSMTEPALQAKCEWETGKSEITLITTAIIHHLKTDLFLETAFKRMIEMHRSHLPQTSLKKIEELEKKPWAYISGGTPSILLQSYFCLSKEVTEEVRKVESPSDLALFLIDLMKGLPYQITEPYEVDTERPFLMFSPTHAFLFKPGLEPFKSGWQDRGFTYTWFRDHFLVPAKSFYNDTLLNVPQQIFLMKLFMREYFFIADDAHLPFSPFPAPVSASTFRNHFLAQIPKGFSLTHIADQLDGFLYKHLPCHPIEEGKKCAIKLLTEVLKNSPSLLNKAQNILKLLMESSASLVTAMSIREVVKGTLALLMANPSLSFDVDEEIALVAQKVEAATPQPLLFGDTNWPHFYFGL